MKLVELEIKRHDWTKLRCGCGMSAAHVATDLVKLARSDKESGFDIEMLDGHVLMPSVLFEPSVPTVSVALAALADDISPSARGKFLELLLLLVAGEGQATELALQGRDLVIECVSVAKSGIWLLYSEVFSGRSIDAASYAYEALTLIEDDADRLEHVRIAAGEFLRWDLR
ncbi:hypothetical protein ACIGZJ_27230 [Kitasatospora sp. NPDC052868]|uniref:hypothetical protein n=1 Tax=Kitasatospora sp. NPDC052868 TaxID=3364060 RepID=UPI0037C5CB26